MSAGSGPSVDDNSCSKESHSCKNCDKTGENKELLRCVGFKARWYCSKTCQTRDWDNHKEICKIIQALAIRYDPPELGKGDSEDEQAYKTHLTPKQHAKLVKLVGEKCNVKCNLNDVELCSVGYWRSNKSIKCNTVKEILGTWKFTI